MEKEKKKLNKWFIPLFIVLGLVLLFVLIGFINLFLNLSLRHYIKSYSKVEYSERIEPVKDENGYYSFISDSDIKVLELTDIHLGGGFLSYRKDKKTIDDCITMIQAEKPDLVILNGDNVFAIPYISGTLNNKMVSKTVVTIFDHLEVYFSTVFGNHETEVFDYYNRQALGKFYQNNKSKYCLFESNFNEYGVSNQVILTKRPDGLITKTLLLLDSNSYVDNSIKSVINWDYDVINDSQIKWAKEVIEDLSNKNKETFNSLSLSDISNLDPEKFIPVKSIFFFHIPISEFEIAYEALYNNNFNDTENAKYISGVFGEYNHDDPIYDKICYGGWLKGETLGTQDNFFEELIETNSLEMIICGHDHTNNAVVEYEGVVLAYSYSIDNLAYSNIDKSGLQRGCNILTIKNNGDIEFNQKNLYLDGYKSEKNTNYDVYLDHYYYDEFVQPQK